MVKTDLEMDTRFRRKLLSKFRNHAIYIVMAHCLFICSNIILLQPTMAVHVTREKESTSHNFELPLPSSFSGQADESPSVWRRFVFWRRSPPVWRRLAGLQQEPFQKPCQIEVTGNIQIGSQRATLTLIHGSQSRFEFYNCYLRRSSTLICLLTSLNRLKCIGSIQNI